MHVKTQDQGLVPAFTEKQLLHSLENIVSDSLEENHGFDPFSKE